jgi:hypothetical protein
MLKMEIKSVFFLRKIHETRTIVLARHKIRQKITTNKEKGKKEKKQDRFFLCLVNKYLLLSKLTNINKHSKPCTSNQNEPKRSSWSLS